MNERSFICSDSMSPIRYRSITLDRRTQILDAAVICFAKRGFHQTSMHDISAEAGISVGLIYRYFENKEEVISAMADRHKKEIHEVLERARQAPTLARIAGDFIYCALLRKLAASSVGVRGRSLRRGVAKSARGGSGARRFANGDGRRDGFDRALAGSAKSCTTDLTPRRIWRN